MELDATARSGAEVLATEFVQELLRWAFEATSLEDLMEKYDVDEGGGLEIMYALGTSVIDMYWDDEDDDCHCSFAVGDDDFTVSDEEYDCCPETNGVWFCTRVENHCGPHAAGDGDEIGAVWE